MREPGDSRSAPTLSLSGVRSVRPRDRSPEDWEKEQFFETLDASLRGKGGPFNVAIDIAEPSGEYKIVGPDAPLDGYIQSLALNVASITVTLSNVSVKELFVGAEKVNLHLNNCNIGLLRVQDHRKAEIRVHESNIGTLNVRGDSIGYYEMKGGSLLNVVCPAPKSDNPFTGTVSFTPNVFFPRKRGTYILPGPQPYRNLRYHLRALENVQMANLIHSAELAVERKDDPWTNKVLSWFYEMMSDFGSSALRSILWLVLLYLLSAWAILWSDGAVSAAPTSELIGWQQALVDPLWGEEARSLYLAFQPLVNPIGIFGPKSLLIPRYPLLALGLSLQGLLSLILLALLIFAIRRRFKIQA